MKKLLVIVLCVAMMLTVLPTVALAEETPVLATGVTVMPTTLSLKKGTTAQLTASVQPDDATDTTVTWESSKPEVATVNAAGNVEGHSLGKATITATANDGSGKSASCTVTVNDGGIWGGIRWTFVVTDEATGKGKLIIEPAKQEEIKVETKNRTSPYPFENKPTIKAGEKFASGEWAAPVETDGSPGMDYSAGYYAYNNYITSVEIMHGVTSIGSLVCNGMKLEGEIVIPATVRYIGQDAFNVGAAARTSQNGWGFTKVTFATYKATDPEVVAKEREVGESDLRCVVQGAFKYNAMEIVEFPEGVECIHGWAFQGCTNIKSVTIPQSVKSIPAKAHLDYDANEGSPNYSFIGCRSLEKVVFNDPEDATTLLNNIGLGQKCGHTGAVTTTAGASNGGAIYAGAKAIENALKEAESNDIIKLMNNVAVAEGTTLVIPEGVTLDLNGKTLTINGVLDNFGAIKGSGSIANDGSFAGTGTTDKEIAFSGSAKIDTIYSITYDTDVGNPTYYHESTADFTLTNPSDKTGYDFAGWSGPGLTGEGNNTVDISELIEMEAGNVTYTAHWTPHTYSIAFDGNGGEGTMATMEGVSYGTAAELPANTFTRSGYTFGGWSTAPNGGTSYADKASVSNLTSVDGGSVTLYAKWNEIVYAPPTYSAAAPEGVKLSTANTYAGTTVRANVEEDSGFDGVRVFDSDGNLLRVDGKDGEFSFTMPGENVRVEPFANPFEDVVEEDYHHDAAIWGYANGITEGVAENLFGSEQNCTRAELVTFLWRLAGCPAPAGAQGEFEDVDPEAYYAAAVQWAAENGITEGTGGGAFSPDAACDRAQIAVFLCRMLKGTADGDGIKFTDVDPEAYYAAAVQWAAENGITVGTGDGTFSPDAICDRAQMIAFLWRCFAK